MTIYCFFCVCFMVGFIFGDDKTPEFGTIVVLFILSPILTPYFIGVVLMAILNKK